MAYKLSCSEKSALADDWILSHAKTTGMVRIFTAGIRKDHVAFKPRNLSRVTWLCTAIFFSEFITTGFIRLNIAPHW